MDLKKLGKILKEKREELHLSLRKASELIGVSHTYLSNLEKAIDPRSNVPVRPTIDTLKLISSAYKMDVNKLVELAGYDFLIDEKNKNDSITYSKEDMEIAERIMKKIVDKKIHLDKTKAHKVLKMLDAMFDENESE